jgi:hypothetical protein
MTDDQLRALVRDAVARHLGQSAAPPAPVLVLREHPSHYRYDVLDSGDDAAGPGACLIEPAVRCNHCGYCQSHGH